jgi:hypothetical protein
VKAETGGAAQRTAVRTLEPAVTPEDAP